MVIAMILTIAIPTGLIASADAPAALASGEVTDKIKEGSLTTNRATGAFNNEGIDKILDNDVGVAGSAQGQSKFCAEPRPFPNKGNPLSFLWEMTEATAVQSVAISSAADSAAFPGRFPKSWGFFGSNDGTEWTQIGDDIEGQMGTESSAQYIYVFENATAYTHYKIEFYSSNDNRLLSFSELQLSTDELEDCRGEDLEAAKEFDAAAAVLAGFTYAGEEAKRDQVALIREKYEELTAGAKALCKNDVLLFAAEDIIYEHDKVRIMTETIDAISAQVADMIDTGDIDYHVNGEITRLIALYKSFSAADQALITNSQKLYDARADVDEQINDFFTMSATGWNAVEGATATPWLATYNSDQIDASHAAVGDELAFQYARLGYKLGDYQTGGQVQLTADWERLMLSQLTGGDNISSPWDARRWAYVVTPFAGMAFSSTGYFSISDYKPAISSTFFMDGNVYIQYWNQYRSYKYQPLDVTLPSSARPQITTTNNFPGNGGSADVTKNSFRYAYAKFNQDNKWDDGIVGIPVGNVITASSAVYQEFKSADGTRYIVGSSAAIAEADANAPDTQIAFVLDDATVTAITALGSGDFEAGLAITGGPISSLDDDKQFFENKIAVHDGDTVTFEDMSEAEAVIMAIKRLPYPITRDVYYTDAIGGVVNSVVADAVTGARAAYEALEAGDKAKVTNLGRLEECEAQIVDIIADRTAGMAVRAQIADLPQESVVIDDEDAIVAARTAFDALTPAQSWYVNNLGDLEWCEDQLLRCKANIIRDMINALPSPEEVRALVVAGPSAALDKVIADAGAAQVAYESAPANIQKYVLFAAVEKLYAVLDELVAKVGDLDGDGNVDVSDVIMMRNWIMEGNPTPERLLKGDLDKDGVIDVSDVIKLRNIIMGVAE